MTKPVALPRDARILVVALRRLGDVLLTTPLIRSVKRAFPDAAIDALVFAGTEGVLAGNSDLKNILTIPPRAKLGATLSLLRRIAKRYDLALSTQTGDRPTTLAVIAGRQSAGLLQADGLAASAKRFLLDRSCVTDPDRHRVLDILRLSELLGIPAAADVVCPLGPVRPGLVPAQSYAVLHAAPMFTYKRWSADGWRKLAAALRERGLATVVTGAASDRAYLDEVWQSGDQTGAITRLDGALTWPELTAVIGAARAYIGPDTAITHLAAASGAPTVALYGPTDPRIWGPWPRGGLDRAWASSGTIQRRGNVWLVQNPLLCLPCQQEGCDRRLDSHSQCLDTLTVAQVVSAVDEALAMRQAA
jgi:lipopolysaccharide heptosyltransferase III